MDNLTKKIVSTLIEKSNNGSTPISFESETEPKMNKRGNPYFGKVIKVSFVGGLIGVNYSNCVNNQLDREGKEKDFVSQPRQWGIRDENYPFLVHHKGETYLTVKVQQTNKKPIFLDKESRTEINKDLLSPYLPQSRKPNTQKDLDKEIVMRDYKISNLKQISIGGEKFTFNEDTETEVKVGHVSIKTSTKEVNHKDEKVLV